MSTNQQRKDLYPFQALGSFTSRYEAQQCNSSIPCDQAGHIPVANMLSAEHGWHQVAVPAFWHCTGFRFIGHRKWQMQHLAWESPSIPIRARERLRPAYVQRNVRVGVHKPEVLQLRFRAFAVLDVHISDQHSSCPVLGKATEKKKWRAGASTASGQVVCACKREAGKLQSCHPHSSRQQGPMMCPKMEPWLWQPVQAPTPTPVSRQRLTVCRHCYAGD